MDFNSPPGVSSSISSAAAFASSASRIARWMKRALLGATTPSTRIRNTVAASAPAYADSLAAGRLVSRDATTRIADGMACRTPVADALDQIRDGVDRVVKVSDDEIESAMRAIGIAFRQSWPSSAIRARSAAIPGLR